MTNPSRNLCVPTNGLLALTFFCLLIAQSAMATSETSVTHSIPYYEEGTVPLPGEDDYSVWAKRPKLEPRNHRVPLTIPAPDGGTAPVNRSKPDMAASVMQGGDTYATATVLPGAGYYTGTTVGYTYDYDESLCRGGTGCPDVVYSYTPPVDAFLDVSLCNSGGTDTKVWVIDATTMTEIQCNDDGADCPGYESHISAFAVTGGAELYIVIGGYNANAAGHYFLELSEYAEGIDCQAPIEIGFDPGYGEAYDTQSWTVDLAGGGPNSSVGAPNSLFYNFTSERSGEYAFRMEYDRSAPIGLYLGIAGAIECQGDYGPGAYALTYDTTYGPYELVAILSTGRTYMFELFDWDEGQTGTLTITRGTPEAPNDECADAEKFGNLGTGSGIHNVSNLFSTLSTGFDYTFCDPSAPTNTCSDVWYVWEADIDGYVQFDMCAWGSSDFDSKLFVYRGYNCTGSEVIDPLGCSDDGCGYFNDGALVEMECSAGEQFTIRLAGWHDPAGACSVTGLGIGVLDIYQTDVSLRPPNDDCPDAVVGVLAMDGDVYTTTGNLLYSSWGSCPGEFEWSNPEAGLGPIPWRVFDAFSIAECTNIRIDYCGSEDDPGYTSYDLWPKGVKLLAGCPCEGPMVTILASGGTFNGTCDPAIYADPDFNGGRGWDFPGLIPGTYYWKTSNWEMGRASIGGRFIYPHDYVVNFRGTPTACEYCEATANINLCPPTLGARWIDGVDFADISTSASGCNAYEDNTGLVASLYKGIDYDLSVVMGKVGTASEHDYCDAWIDWNQNSGLAASIPDMNEKIDLERSGLTCTASVSVPGDAAEPGEGVTGVTLMRVRVAYDGEGENTPCGDRIWGEVEDFTIEVIALECGDFDVDGLIDARDIAFLHSYYFTAGVAPDHWQRADIDGDGVITLADLIALVDVAYHGGTAICIM